MGPLVVDCELMGPIGPVGVVVLPGGVEGRPSGMGEAADPEGITRSL